MDPTDYSWASQHLNESNPTGSDGHSQLSWPPGYAEGPSPLGVTHNFATNMAGIPSVAHPRTAGSWHDADPNSIRDDWLPGIMQLELPESRIQQATAKPPEGYPMLSTKRRLQNREAQRRFRQKREEKERLLQERISDLEAKCKILRESLHQKSGETELPLREKRELEAQVQVLRKQEQMLLRLLQEQKGALLESFLSQAGHVSGSSSVSAGTPETDPAAGTVDASQRESELLVTTTDDIK